VDWSSENGYSSAIIGDEKSTLFSTNRGVKQSFDVHRRLKSLAKLVYSMVMSLDGYTEDEHGRFGWGVAGDAELHSDICKLVSSFGTYLFGRKIYEV
jgi:hypothetical protein